MRAVPLIVLSMIASPAAADVVSSSANGFHIRETVQMVVPTDRAYAAFARLPQWWNKAHTYSGDSANLNLALTAGGCFCEKLTDGGGVEHMRVAFVDLGKGRRVKVLGNGAIERKVTVRAHAVSASARTKIEAAGGTVELLES